jgi:hypothetical protein
MDEISRASLSAWADFYVIVGSAAAALTGLQFVVIALVNDTRQPASEQTISAFSTPTVVHFAIALLTSAILTAPWPALWQTSVATVACATASFVYALIVLHRARRQTQYKPVMEDWIWHVALPLVAYTVLAISAALLPRHRIWAPFGVATAVLLLVFIGIHNAWDTVTYVALNSVRAAAIPADRDKSNGSDSESPPQ